MKAAAQAYRSRRQTHAYGIGARNHFRSPTHVFLPEPQLLQTNDNNQSDDVIHLRYQHHARQPRASVLLARLRGRIEMHPVYQL